MGYGRGIVICLSYENPLEGFKKEGIWYNVGFKKELSAEMWIIMSARVKTGRMRINKRLIAILQAEK